MGLAGVSVKKLSLIGGVNIFMKVFGLGFPKTGTTTLETMLFCLGKRHCVSHWNKASTNFLVHAWKTKDYEEIKRIINAYDAFADAPWGGTDLYKHLIQNYPKEKYILTERDPESWFNSLKNMAGKFLLPEGEILDFHYYAGMYGFVNWVEQALEVPTISDFYKDKIIEKYKAVNNDVKAQCKKKNIDLLVLNTKELNSWDTICEFLNVNKPSIEVPRANKGVDKGSFSIDEAVLLIRYYLSKNNIAGATSLHQQLVQSGATGIGIDVLTTQIQAATRTNSLLMAQA